ncbi:hypothetical protein D3C77_773000 [compost metagenome]
MNDEVADLAAQVLPVLALYPVDETVFQLRHAYADGGIVPLMQGVAAGAGIDGLAL